MTVPGPASANQAPGGRAGPPAAATYPAAAPALAIVRGNPSAEQVAALVAVLAALPPPAPQAAAVRAMRSEWSARSRMLREPLRRGPGAWRASGLPR